MNHTALEQEQCPLCDEPGHLWTRRSGRELRRCRACGFVWVPQGLMRAATGRSIYEEEFQPFDQYADYYQDQSTVDAAHEKLLWVSAYSRAGGRLLDVGANFGYFAKEASARFDVLGIEPGPGLVEWGRARLQAPIEVGSIYDERPELVGRFDVITMFDVIEHVPDPRGALERCRQYLAPGGRLFVTTPDTESVMARLLGSHWYYVDMVQHIALFGRSNLRRLLTDTGFSSIATRTFGRRYRFSYIERRFRDLAAQTSALRVAHVASLPLTLWPEARITLNLGDVMGIVAEPRSS